MAEFKYQEPFPVEKDTTEYRLLTKDYVKTIECEGRKILKIEKEGLELLAKEAYTDVSFYLRASHLQKLADILKDPEASDNDKFVAHTMLMNQVVSAAGELPTCQDTGTAICIVKKEKRYGRTAMTQKLSVREYLKLTGTVTYATPR